MSCRRGPGQFMHDEGVDLGKRTPQAIEILMMMERVASRPIDQTDVGIGPRLPVVSISRSRIEQHVRYTRHGDKIRNRVLTLRERADGYGIVSTTIIPDGAERVAISAPRQPDLSKRGGEHGTHPDGLLTMLCALQRVRYHNQRAATVQAQ